MFCSEDSSLRTLLAMPLGIDASFNAGGDDFKGGIDESFDPPLKEEHKCPICLFGLREPVQTQCGHRFCRDCIVRSLRSEDCRKRCPLDKVDIGESQIFPDASVQREIGMLTVWCRNHKENEGCAWKGPLNELEKHMTECQFIKCVNNCGSVLRKKDCREHALNACSKQYCRVCKEGIPRSEFESHSKECERRETSDILKEFKEIAKSVALLLKRQVDSRFALGLPQEHGIIRQEDDVDNQAKPTKAVEEGARGGQKSSAGYSGYSEDRLFEKTILLQPDLKGRVSNGTFIWKIDNYIECKNQAISRAVPAIHSPPFYTGERGYKMCLRMNFINDSRSPISLFVRMMKGEWDDILEWPFTGQITLAILNQSENVEFRRPISETLVAKPNLRAFQKPTTNRNHTGYGSVEFCPIDQLVQDQFIKNNVLLVRIQIFH